MSLTAIVAKVLRDKADNITDDTSRATHRRWDSFAQVEIVVALEEAFGAKFSNAEIETMTSVAAIRSMLETKGVAVS